MILKKESSSILFVGLMYFISSLFAYPLSFPGASDSLSRRTRLTLSDDVNCVPIKQCKVILQSLNGPITADKIRKLQNITCGFDGGDPKVNCPIQDHISTRTGPLSKINLHPRVSVHSNFELLPDFEDCGVAQVKIRNYILGGVPASLGAYPWMARLGYQKKDPSADHEFYCAGSLISRRYILTAAHCVTGSNPALHVPLIARLGEHDSTIDPEFSPELNASSKVKDVRIDKILMHPAYDPKTRKNDIALIRVGEDISFDTPWIKPICLPLLQEAFPSLAREFTSTEKWYGEIAGWGKTEAQNDGVHILQYAHVPLLSNSACNTIYAGKTTIADSQLCAGGEPGVDSCTGDSGAPLMLFEENSKHYFQGGIVSFGPSVCGMKGYPGIYTRISPYFTWILDSMES